VRLLAAYEGDGVELLALPAGLHPGVDRFGEAEPRNPRTRNPKDIEHDLFTRWSPPGSCSPNPRDLANVEKRDGTPDVTYVSLNEDKPASS